MLIALVLCLLVHVPFTFVSVTLFFLYKNVFYKNIEAEICEILKYFKNKAKAEILKRIDIILCVETSVNTIQFYVFHLTV